MSYDDAMETYGNDHPDLRFGLEMVDVTTIFAECDYKIFNSIVAGGGKIKGINIKGQAANLSKNLLQNELAKNVIQKFGGKGMTWMKMAGGKLDSNIVQFFSEAELADVGTTMRAENDDVLVFVADMKPSLVNEVLGRFRLYIAERLNLIDTSQLKPVWITDFPLFESKDGRLKSVHHPFTMPKDEFSAADANDDLLKLQSRAYDVVINGEEIGGGSIRIHDSELQQKVFRVLGLSEREIDDKFGFFNNALKYGAPPHGGIALGIDRLVSMVLDTPTIRDVIAFPKNRVAFCPLTEAPSKVDIAQLKELNLEIKEDLT